MAPRNKAMLDANTIRARAHMRPDLADKSAVVKACEAELLSAKNAHSQALFAADSSAIGDTARKFVAAKNAYTAALAELDAIWEEERQKLLAEDRR